MVDMIRIGKRSFVELRVRIIVFTIKPFEHDNVLFVQFVRSVSLDPCLDPIQIILEERRKLSLIHILPRLDDLFCLVGIYASHLTQMIGLEKIVRIQFFFASILRIKKLERLGNIFRDHNDELAVALYVR